MNQRHFSIRLSLISLAVCLAPFLSVAEEQNFTFQKNVMVEMFDGVSDLSRF